MSARTSTASSPPRTHPLANFPNGVTYQRNANFATQTLLNNDGITPVNVSIDPFFYRLEDIPASADFYVADWTSSATSFDLGVEPSIEPVFYAFSDVWNRLSNAPGAFDANNRPANQEATNGAGAAETTSPSPGSAAGRPARPPRSRRTSSCRSSGPGATTRTRNCDPGRPHQLRRR